MRSARAARPADGPAMPRHVTAIAARPWRERTQRQCSGRAVIFEGGTWRRLRMLRDVEFKAAPQECSEKLPVPPALDAVALMPRDGARPPSPARGEGREGGYLNAQQIAAPNAYPAHTATRQSPTDAAT